jgi:hypothetical protein
MTKTLHCEIGNHDWEHPGGRGRPPRNCPKHQPNKDQKKPESRPKPPKKQLPNPAEIPINRHPEPERHKQAREAANNPFIKRATEKKKAETVERLQKGKQEKRIERTQIEVEPIEKEYLEIDNRIERAQAEYDTSLADTKKAKTKEEIDKAFNKSDTKQNALLSLIARKRKLEAMVDQMTDPTGKTMADIENLSPLPAEPVWVDVSPEPLSDIEAAELEKDSEPWEEEQRDDETPTEESDGYNDLLSNPEQFDNPWDEVADMLKGFE